ncbi:hypothetical protein KSP40_PGU004444 [Platanthera guangdongensis]|uniref:Uncharacterized protein n=1 Tax=Platanthera guangdongensis TaxID=2320717 RepID=A0ABR2LRX0_9ASPA
MADLHSAKKWVGEMDIASRNCKREKSVAGEGYLRRRCWSRCRRRGPVLFFAGEKYRREKLSEGGVGEERLCRIDPTVSAQLFAAGSELLGHGFPSSQSSSPILSGRIAQGPHRLLYIFSPSTGIRSQWSFGYCPFFEISDLEYVKIVPISLCLSVFVVRFGRIMGACLPLPVLMFVFCYYIVSVALANTLSTSDESPAPPAPAILVVADSYSTIEDNNLAQAPNNSTPTLLQ